MSLSLAQKPIRRKTQFSTTATVMPMTTTRRETVRPQIQPCPLCSPDLPILEVKAANGLVYLVDCPVCNGTGYINRRDWHPAAWLPKWALSLAAFVGVL